MAPLGSSVPVAELRRAILSQSPYGTTPLTEAVMNIVSMLEPVKEKLRARGERVVVIIATDGLPNDSHSFLQAMKQLQTLPVWVVVRLCTDDDKIVDYWNELDAQLDGSGANALHAAIALCERVSIYGFGLYGRRPDGDKL